MERERQRLEVKQGASVYFTVRWPGFDLTAYDVYFQVRKQFASSVAEAAKEPVFALSLVSNSSVDNAIQYGDAVESVVDSVRVQLHADKTALLENQEATVTGAQYLADLFLVSKTDSTRVRQRPADFDIFVDPRVTVVA